MNLPVGYKYRGGDDNVFERDLESLESNYFWAPSRLELNDPCETLVSAEMLRRQIDGLTKLFGQNKTSIEHLYSAIDTLLDKRSKVGIYSLSTSFDHELLWAHYADSHKGFCIQYDLDLLVNQNIYQDLHIFPVVYKKELPSISIEDISKERDYFFRKVFGTKSNLWTYEKEIRVITDTFGENDYDYSAVIAIYFGYRMLDQHKKKMMNRLQGRGIKYFQMYLEDNSYKFRERPVEDIYENAQPYLCQISKDTGTISYEIIKKAYHQHAKKGTIDIKLERKISEQQLKSIAHQLKQKIFRNAERVFMSYFLPDMENGNGAWATTHFESNQFDIRINGFTIEQEEKLVDGFETDTRNIIGRWLDNSPLLSHSLTLFRKDSGLFLERNFSDGSSQTNELRPSNIDEGIRYDDIEENSHSEYFTVDSYGTLHLFSSEGEFRKLRPYLQTKRSPE